MGKFMGALPDKRMSQALIELSASGGYQPYGQPQTENLFRLTIQR